MISYPYQVLSSPLTSTSSLSFQSSPFPHHHRPVPGPPPTRKRPSSVSTPVRVDNHHRVLRYKSVPLESFSALPKGRTMVLSDTSPGTPCPGRSRPEGVVGGEWTVRVRPSEGPRLRLVGGLVGRSLRGTVWDRTEESGDPALRPGRRRVAVRQLRGTHDHDGPEPRKRGCSS